MSEIANSIQDYYVNAEDFNYLRDILEHTEKYKIKFSVDLKKLSIEDKITNAYRIAFESYIENELLSKDSQDSSIYIKYLQEFNKDVIKKGYKPFYDVPETETIDINGLKRFPTPYYKGHSDRGEYFYPVSNFLPVYERITPRYHRPRLYYHSSIPESLTTILKPPQEWSYNTPVPSSPILQIQLPQIQLPSVQLPSNQLPQIQIPQTIDDLTVSAIKDDDKFSINNKKIHLTYSYHPNLPKLYDYLSDLAKKQDNKIITYSMVHENGNYQGTGTNHPHTHVALFFDNPIRTTKSSFFDYNCPLNPVTNPEFVHPHIRPVKYKKHWDRICTTYHRKEGGELFSNYITQSTTKEQKPNYNLTELVKIYREKGENGIADYVNRIRPNDISRVNSICQTAKNYILNENKEKLKQENQINLELNDWHKHIINHEIPNNTDRILVWVYDPVGNEQKTTFANYLKRYHDAVVITAMSSKNALYQLAIEHENRIGNPIKIVIFDIPRSVKNIDELYTTIEMIKNGSFTSEKYKSREIELGCKPVVIVFSNAAPNIKHCTVDRWKVLSVNEGQIQHLFANDTERNKHEKALQIINEIETTEMDNKVVKSFNDPYKIWPIETFPAGKEYINLIQEILDSCRVPKVEIEYRPLTSKERLERRIMIKPCSEIREKLFKDVDKSIVPFAETTYRCIFHREQRKGYVWDVTDITAREMSADEKVNHLNNKHRIEERIDNYQQKELDEFERNFRKRIMSCN